MIKNSKYQEYFPYTSYRNRQEGIIAQIEQDIRTKKNILLNAPNGTGKTIIALSAILPVALEQGLKILFLCRTHAQSDRVIKELVKIYKSSRKNTIRISGISIRGRSEMCLNRTLLQLKATPTEAMSVCKNLRLNKNCLYFRNLKEHSKNTAGLDKFLLKRPIDADQLLTYCREQKYCPYFLAQYLFKEMPVVVCNFQWIFNPDIRHGFLKLLKTRLENCILIIYECHNIVDIATEINSDKLIPFFLTNCQNDLQTYQQIIKFIHKFFTLKR